MVQYVSTYLHTNIPLALALWTEWWPRSLPLVIAQVPTLKVRTLAGRDLGIVPAQKTSERRSEACRRDT